MSVWFVKPEEVQIDLSYTAPDGTAYPFWIKVKKYLTVGEQRRVMTAGWKGMRSGGAVEGGQEIQIDWKVQTFARTEAFLTAWSFGEGKDAPSRASIEALHSDVYTVIENAINAHVAAIEEEKKVPSGSAALSATSA